MQQSLLKNHHVIVIGASAGGVQALMDIVSQLPEDFPASIHIVQHISTESPSSLATVLSKVGQLRVKFATDGEPIKPSQVYIAPPDFHLMLEPGRMRVIRGPRENRMRPAIDPLFRSAAVAYRSYVTGVVLTGMLDDGTVGLQAIKACGGMAIVQDPDQAEYDSMPKSAIANVEVDQVVLVQDMGSVLAQRVRQIPASIDRVPAHLELEAPIPLQAITEPETLAQIGNPMAQSCPSCGGPLWQIGKDLPVRYRCHIGHAFTSRTLIEEQNEATEKALWAALRTLEERSRMLKNMGKSYAEKGATKLAEIHQKRSSEALDHAVQIRSLIRDLKIVIETSEEKVNREAS